MTQIDRETNNISKPLYNERQNKFQTPNSFGFGAAKNNLLESDQDVDDIMKEIESETKAAQKPKRTNRFKK